MAPVEITSVSAWNTALRTARASGQTVVVDFWAAWCGPCKAIAPKYDQLAGQYDRHVFLRVDVDAQPAIAKNAISAMPTFLVLQAGTVVDSLKGADPAGLVRLVSKHASQPPVEPLPEPAEEAKQKGNDAFKASDYPLAITHYTSALSYAPSSPTLLLNRSLASLRAGRPAEACDDARAVVESDPKSGKGWVRLGDALLAAATVAVDEGRVEKKDQEREAKEAYVKALALLPAGLMRTEVEGKLAKL